MLWYLHSTGHGMIKRHVLYTLSDRIVVQQQKRYGLADLIGYRTWSKALRYKQVVIELTITLAKSAWDFKLYDTHTHTHTHMEDWPWQHLCPKSTPTWTNLSQAKGKLYHLYKISGIYENDRSAAILFKFQDYSYSNLHVFGGCFSHA